MERRGAPLLDDDDNDDSDNDDNDAATCRSRRSLVEPGFSPVGGALHAPPHPAHPRRRVDAAFRVARLEAGVPSAR